MAAYKSSYEQRFMPLPYPHNPALLSPFYPAVVDTFFYPFHPEKGISIDKLPKLISIEMVVKDRFQKGLVVSIAEKISPAPPDTPVLSATNLSGGSGYTFSECDC